MNTVDVLKRQEQLLREVDFLGGISFIKVIGSDGEEVLYRKATVNGMDEAQEGKNEEKCIS